MRALVFLAMLTIPVHAAELQIGYLSLDGDPRYTLTRAEARIDPLPHGNALPGAELGIADTQMQLRHADTSIVLDQRSGMDAASLVDALQSMSASVVLTDLPGELLAAVAGASPDRLLINISATEDHLRCLPNVLHTMPSDRMAADAMAQLLTARKWTRVLLLEGEEPRDKQLADDFAAAAERYRLQLVDRRQFALATDPANRAENNTLLLTGNLDYDVVYIADSVGDFAPYLPYGTALPRPVMGSAGLKAVAWHWSADRYGAPQVNGRFVKAAKQRMQEADWAAWMAVKLVAEAVLAGATDAQSIRAALLSETIQVDGSKGIAEAFRPWDGQLRMPMLLATDSKVIAMAPFDGFAHQANELDTLGVDAPEHVCP